jgi:hypothetical protein
LNRKKEARVLKAGPKKLDQNPQLRELAASMDLQWPRRRRATTCREDMAWLWVTAAAQSAFENSPATLIKERKEVFASILFG